MSSFDEATFYKYIRNNPYYVKLDSISFGNSVKLYMTSAPPTLKDASILAQELHNKDVSYLLVLLSHEELSRMYGSPQSLYEVYKEGGINTYSYPIDDYSIPSDMRSYAGVIDRLIKILQSGSSIAVHCHGGHGRTGLIAVGTVIRLGNSVDKAYKYVNSIRSVIDTPQQMKFLEEYSKYLQKDKK